MGNATLFASKLLIKQSMITMNTNLMMSCNDKCIFYMRFFEHAYTACESNSIYIVQPRILSKN